MTYQSVGFIHQGEADGWQRHTEVLECGICGALVSANSLADHDRWHAEIVTPS